MKLNNKVAVALITITMALVIIYWGQIKIWIQIMNREIALGQLHKNVKSRFVAFFADVEKSGWTVTYNSVYRSFAAQSALKAKQPTLAASPGTSAHNYGFAVDCNFTKNGVTLLKATTKASWEASGIPALAKKHGLRWGGNFVSTDYDPIHFDAFSSASDYKKYLALAYEQFGTDNSKIIGNAIRL